MLILLVQVHLPHHVQYVGLLIIYCELWNWKSICPRC